jgi:hypothetical protein
MTNYIYNFNGMNAHDIANQIIKNEEAYLKTDFNKLSFEEKCHLALHHTAAHHPLFRQLDVTSLTESIYPELVCKAEEEDAFALYCLAALFTPDVPRAATRNQYLDRAISAGSIEARLHAACRDAAKNLEELRLLNTELKLLAVAFYGEWNDHLLYLCNNTLASYETDPDKKEAAKRVADELAVKGVLEGNYYYLTHLCVKNKLDVKELAEGRLFDDETLFWKTVSFLVESEFYERGALHLADHLGIRLIRGIGCERDLERAKQIYVDAMFSKAYDRMLLMDVAKIKDADLDVAEEACRKQIDDGKVSDFWRLILIALLSGERSKVESACDEVIATGLDAALANIPKAYHMLCQAKL